MDGMNKEEIIRKLNVKERNLFKNTPLETYMTTSRNLFFFIKRKGIVREFYRYLKSEQHFRDMKREYQNFGKIKNDDKMHILWEMQE